MNKTYRLRIVRHDHAVREIQIAADAPLVLPAEPGAHYALIDAASGALAKAVTLSRDGLALIVDDGTGTVVRVDDFYDRDRAADAVFDVASGDASAPPVHITAADAASGSGHVVWPTAGFDAGTALAGSADAASSEHVGHAGLTGLGALGVLGAIGIGIGLAASGGGSNSGSSAAPVATGSGFANAVDVSVVGGPVLAGNDLKVAIYSAEGKLLDIAQLDSQGHLTIAVGEYTGVVIAKVGHDTDNVADYLDEATGTGKSLGVDLYATGVVSGQNATVSLNLNLLTTLAYQKAIAAAGVDPLAGHGALDATTVTSVNQAVATAFGLSDLHGAAVVTVNGANTSFNAADGISAAERYGEILAALSGSDLQHGGNTQETLDQLVAGVVVTTSSGGAAVATLAPAGNALINSGAAAYDHASGAATLGSISNHTAPTVLGLTFSTASTAHAPLVAGDTLTVTVAYSEAVNVDGQPQLLLDIGGTQVLATYAGGSGTANLSFSYVVVTGESDTDGVAVPVGQLLLPGAAAIRAADDGQAAVLDHNGLAADPHYLVAAVPPGVVIAQPIHATDDVGSVTGSLSGGAHTDDPALALTGTCEAGATVQIYDGNTLLGTAVVTGTTWSYSAAIADGHTYSFHTVVTSSTGVVSAPSPDFVVVGDTSAPAASAITATDDVGPVTGSLASGAHTDDPALALTGTCEAGATVAIYDGNTLLGMAIVTGTTWSYSAAIADGTTYSFHTVVTDSAGNASAPSANLVITGDTSAPVPGAITATDDVGSVTGILANGARTDDTALALSGTCEAGATVQIYDGSTLLGSAVVTGTTWSYSAAIADGTTYSFHTVVTDTAGNASAPGANFVVTGDTTPPAVTFATAVDDVGSVTGSLANGAHTDDPSVALAGACEAGATVQIYDGTTLLGAATVSGTGWTYNAAFVDGHTYHLNAVATDAAGNHSAPTADFVLVGDTTPPAVALTQVTDDVGNFQGPLSSGHTTDDPSVLVTGTCEAGATVGIYDNTTLLGYATVSGTSWTYSAAVTDGTTLHLSAVATDAAGNASAATPHFDVIGDMTAPTVTVAASSVTSGTDTAVTSSEDGTVYLVDSSITVTDLASITGAAGDHWNSTNAQAATSTTLATTGLVAGTYHAYAVDAAGNLGAASSNAVTVTAAAPAASNIVVFDLVHGVSSDHDSRTFDPTISYHIYVMVSSTSPTLTTTPNGAAAGATWGEWSGAGNLGSDDHITFVGTGSDVKGPHGNNAFHLSSSSSYAAIQTQYGVGGSNDPLFGTAIKLHQSNGGMIVTRGAYGSAAHKTFIHGSAPSSFYSNQRNLGGLYQTHIPPNILHTQGLA